MNKYGKKKRREKYIKKLKEKYGGNFQIGNRREKKKWK